MGSRREVLGSKPKKGRGQTVEGSESLTVPYPLCPFTLPFHSGNLVFRYRSNKRQINFLPGKGCKGTAGSWHSKRHTTGGGTERPGGSQCPGPQGPGGTGAQGKGKASGGRLSSRGP